MASVVASSAVVAPAAFAAAAPASTASESSTVRAFVGLKSGAVFSGRAASLSAKTVSNGSRVNCMEVWCPYGNPKFETLSYLPPLTPDMIAKEIDYMLAKKWIPCLEFDVVGTISRFHNQSPGYYDGRYWTMWKLPMFGCQDSASVLREIENCKKEYGHCFIRVLGFDASRQVQCAGFIVHKP
eukprot:TRINITY_DN18894_c0_g1_i1.p1 TRINITY_DN18894_c0_g1~~TRINITY_DN18894_c0_g1_i1.p1  ORF type:complete len:200 (+),score=18.64 TRINITY_DN18894_c0_g1_i1:52-600(+)